MLSAPMDDLVDGGSGYTVLAREIADADMVCVVLMPDLTALNGSETSSFMNGHGVYSTQVANCIQR